MEVDFSDIERVKKRMIKFMSKWDEYSEELSNLKFSDYRFDEYLEDLHISENKFDNKLLSTHSDNIRDEYRTLFYNRFKTMGTLGRYKTYKFFNDGEKLRVEEFKHDKRNHSVRDLIRKGKVPGVDHVKIGLPLPITENCKLVGVVNTKSRRSYSDKHRVYEKDTLLDYFVNRVDVNYIEDEFNNIQVFSGDWAHSSQNLIDMATPKEKIFTRYDIMEGYLSRIGIDLKLPYVEDFNAKQVLNLDVNPKAYPGFSTSQKIAKYRKKTSPYTKDYAYKYATRIMKNERQILDTSIVVVGGREKRAKYKVEEKGKKVKTRITCMGEDVPTLISQALVNPITNCTPEIGDHFSQLAKVYGQGNMLRFVESMKPSNWDELICDLDYSGHDNNTSEEQVVAAFALLRLCFKESIEIDRLFYYCMSSMIYKRVLLPESNLVYQLNKGISTGHGFTSLVTTICSYGTLATAINKVVKKKDDTMVDKYMESSLIANAGDDVNIRLHVDIINDVYQEVMVNSGHTIDDMNNNGYHISNNIDSRVTFFKKQFMDFSWNDRELFTNLVHPTIMKKNYGLRSENLKVLMYQSPMNLNLNNKLICLIVSYILSGRGYRHRDMLAAQQDGRILSTHSLIEYCIKVGFQNTNFIDELLKLNYGSFMTVSAVREVKTLIGNRIMYGNVECSVDASVKAQLREMKKVILQKREWFSHRVNYKMHLLKQTLTVYDFMKTFVRAKSNNVSFHSLRLYYNKLNLKIKGSSPGMNPDLMVNTIS